MHDPSSWKENMPKLARGELALKSQVINLKPLEQICVYFTSYQLKSYIQNSSIGCPRRNRLVHASSYSATYQNESNYSRNFHEANEDIISIYLICIQAVVYYPNLFYSALIFSGFQRLGDNGE